jgi:dTMP kinase
LVVGDFRPDLTMILDVPVATGLRRAAARHDGEDRYEGLDRAFHERLRAGFHDIAKREPDRCLIIDAAGDVATVHRAVCAAITVRLGVMLP